MSSKPYTKYPPDPPSFLKLRCKLGLHKWDFEDVGKVTFCRCHNPECKYAKWYIVNVDP